MLSERLVVVVVPAFQEEAHIVRVLQTMPAFVDRIFVVDDASTDGTSARAVAVGDRRVEILRHARRSGVGAAIVSGYRAALRATRNREDAVCVMAGDGQMDPADLRAVALPIVRGEADFVKGDRFGAQSVKRTMGWPRWVGGRVFSRLTALAIGQPISDSQCGYTAVSRSALGRLDLAGLWPSFGYPNDLLGQLAARRCRIREVAVRPIYADEQSKLRLYHLPPIAYLIARAAARRLWAHGRVVERDEEAKKLQNDGAVSS